jgi:hypothetical protein
MKRTLPYAIVAAVFALSLAARAQQPPPLANGAANMRWDEKVAADQQALATSVNNQLEHMQGLLADYRRLQAENAAYKAELEKLKAPTAPMPMPPTPAPAPPAPQPRTP